MPPRSFATVGLLAALMIRTSGKFWSRVRFGDGACRMANRFARALAATLRSSLQAPASCSGWMLRKIGWLGPRGQPAGVLREMLARFGFDTPRPWLFRHHAGPELDLKGPCDLAKLAHALRQGWRASLWERYLDRDRHECRDFRRPRTRLQWKELLDIDFESVLLSRCKVYCSRIVR